MQRRLVHQLTLLALAAGLQAASLCATRRAGRRKTSA